MSKFERIVREPLVMGGQARIRDTGITVNEIVRLSLDGSSQAEILEKFPMLEAEDAYQALAWQSANVNQIANTLAFDMRTSTNAILGYSRLLKQLIPNLSSSIHIFETGLQSMEANAERIYSFLNDFIYWSQVMQRTGNAYEAYEVDWQILARFMDEEILDRTRVYSKTSPSELILMLCTAEIASFTKSNVGKLEINREKSQILFRVIRQGQLGLEILEYPTAIAMANLLIFDNGSELKIREEENSVIFEFALPIVES
jgi:uncharacterized protein (DUF433 family)